MGELKKEKIQSKFINGLRVTDHKVIKIVEKVLIDFNLSLTVGCLGLDPLPNKAYGALYFIH